MGLIDAGNPRSFKSRRGILADETTATPTTDTGVIGGETNMGDPRAAGIDQEPFNGEKFSRDLGKLMDMAMGVSPSASAFNMATGGYAGMGPQMPSFGLNDAVADEIGSAAMGGGGGLASIDVEPSAPGLFAKGGKVGRKGLLDGDPPGPDNVIIGAKTGERILNEKQFASLSKEARAEVERVLKARKK